ncbi:hypothetical protein KJA15_03215 [Patescibacteria group bacterium]|nr:hypothetical protein [Patescibacteria group bacterium]
MARLTGIGVAVMFGMDILGIISVILNRNLLKSKPSTAVEKGDRLGEMLKSKEWALKLSQQH